ncbi:MAG: isoaspartyl peptidase/L-asparaginase [Candidatus Bathyarchaeota archaeon]|nr:MAG: isoaspartyl peptidase/L-asparaginase [Candidatus Bathyarchaeota archaeon]
MKAQRPTIVVHGGAGEWRRERHEAGIAGVEKAAQSGFDILKQDGTALSAVESSVMSMEDNEVFNAGLGSSLTYDKQVEMEASIMDGGTLSAGAVGLVRKVRHPVHLARLVMEKTDHIFLVGKSAERLAKIFKLEERDPTTKLRERYWRELRGKISRGNLTYLRRLDELLKSHPSFFDFDTVGAVAVDKEGNVAAATSTGGISLKIPGRIGDSPLVGCGTYADNEAGACSATGIGEIAIKLVVTKSTCDLMRQGLPPQSAAENIIREVNRRVHDAAKHMGLIAIDSQGRIGASHNSMHMCWAYMTPKTRKPRAFLKAKIIQKPA